jgi:aspartate/methionine/tyrosine aminotransferase
VARVSSASRAASSRASAPKDSKALKAQGESKTMAVSRLKDVPGSIGVDRMGAAADAAHDAAILRLENLDTDIRPAEAALAATRAAIDDDAANSYLPFVGQDALRQAVARHVSQLSGQTYDWQDSCLITAGGTHGILNALLSLVEPGDEVVLNDPIYVGLINRVRLAGGVPRFAGLRAEPASTFASTSASASAVAGWRLDRDALRASITPATRGMLLVSPSMPSGAVLTADDWALVAELCVQHDLWLLYDAAMERILYDGQPYIHPASLPGMASRTITVGTVSKEQRMIGWRVGWIVGPPERLADMRLVCMANVVCPVGIAQAGAAAALTQPDEDLQAAVDEWRRRRDVMTRELEGLPVVAAGGGWSLLIDVSQLGFDSATASRRLMELGQVAATPMVHWGSSSADRFVRFVFANEPCERLEGLGIRVRRALL